MRVGPLRHRVILQEMTATQDATGAQVETWADDATLWAEVRDLSGREYFAAEQAQSEVTAQVLLRYRSDIQPHTHRIKFRDILYDIINIIADPKRETILLMCRVVATQ